MQTLQPIVQGPAAVAAYRMQYTIPLDGYRLSPEALAAHTHPTYLRKRSWDHANIEFIDWVDGGLELLLTRRPFIYRCWLSVQPGQLQVRCSCQPEEDGVLCLHAYKALQGFIVHRGDDCFERYRPGGPVAIAFTHRACYNIQWNHYQLYVRPKSALGEVYIPGTSQPRWAVRRAAPAPPQNAAAPPAKTACYFIIQSARRELLPVLVPCMGTPGKGGSFIKWFDPFFSGTKKEYDQLLTPEQKALNLLCYHLWQAAEALPGTAPDDGGPEMQEQMDRLFHLWQQAYCALPAQPHVYVYNLWRRRELKGKPERKKTRKIQPCPGQPGLQFRLAQQEDLYQLTASAHTAAGRPLADWDASLPFFIMENDKLYLLASLKQALIANWVYQTGNRVTIFKELYPAFEKEVLQELGTACRIEQLPE